MFNFFFNDTVIGRAEADLARSLLFLISNDIGQIACLYAMMHNLKKVGQPRPSSRTIDNDRLEHLFCFGRCTLAATFCATTRCRCTPCRTPSTTGAAVRCRACSCATRATWAPSEPSSRAPKSAVSARVDSRKPRPSRSERPSSHPARNENLRDPRSFLFCLTGWLASA